MEKLTPNELRFIHHKMLELYGGLQGGKRSRIDYVCQNPFLTIYGHEQYPDLFQKATILMYSLSRGHYFFDGNKRTAAMSTYTFFNEKWI